VKCPVCDVTLSISSRDGVEIDFCPQCRGVWLDRGELDKIIERAAAMASPNVPAAAPSAPPPAYRGDDRDLYREDDRRYDERYDDRRDDDRYGKKRKKRSFLEDIFDFD
jgi:Zn-finger nucleic acid-binding protein